MRAWRIPFLTTVGLGVVGLVVVGWAATPPTGDGRPNILFLFSDDQRTDTIGALGNARIETPRLDRLVADGFVLERAYCMGSMSGAVCAPSRAMLMSGRHLFRFDNANPRPAADLPSLPATLRAAGYDTFGTGKWHNGPAWFNAGFADGAEIFFGGMGSHTELMVHDYDATGAYPPEARHRIPSFSSTAFADAAIDFLRRHDGENPFFVYVAFTAPHDPRTPPEEFRAPYVAAPLPLPANYLPLHPFDNGEMVIRDERLAPWPRTPEVVQQHLADYYGMIGHLDVQIGRVLDTLEAVGHADDTIVLYSSDHGLAVGSHGLLGKQNLYEHSVGAPLLVRGPGIAPGRAPGFAYLFDIFPTLCELTGIEVPEGVDGKSLVPVLAGDARTVRDEVFTAYKQDQRALRDERWKLIQYPRINETQLFDLATDPHEMHNLAGEPAHAPRVADMLARLATRQVALGDPAPLTSADPAPREFTPPDPRKSDGK